MTYEEALDALGDPTRRLVFDRLRSGPSSVADLAAGLPVSRPAVSQHLRRLKDAGLVRVEAEGARRLYRIDRAGLMVLRDWLELMWAEAWDSYQAEIQTQIDERKNT